MAVKSIAVHFQWQTSEAYFMWGDITLFFLSAFGMHIDIPFALRQSKREIVPLKSSPLSIMASEER